MSKASKGNEALRVIINGRVQGVGFRPAVYRAAKKRGIRGRVANTPEGAVLEIEGAPQALKRFLKELAVSLPPQARVRSIVTKPAPVRDFAGFSIERSRRGKTLIAEIPPDLSLCPKCLEELFTPSDRRYLYPFINCTDCGPRFSIVRELPYDRPKTTMASFRMCPDCAREYRDPNDRRFHAQPDACPECGPEVSLLSGAFERLSAGQEALQAAVELLRKGKILAVKSLGGYHLACDAGNAAAVSRLRKKKARPHKPLALMLPDIGAARALCAVSGPEEDMLRSPARPIVLLRKRPDIARSLGTAEDLAPGNAFLGVMLPYTPLHYLLFSRECAGGKEPLRALVMTSGNRSDEPICITEKQAQEKLTGIAESFVTHDRAIHNRMDDSIVQRAPGGGQGFTVVRRSRGLVPEPVELAAFSGRRLPSVFAAGAGLKNTFCITRREKAYVSPYIGDLDNRDSLEFYREAADRFTRFLKVRPSLVAHDLHPDYLSTVFARELLSAGRMKGIGVQHHHAHIASVLAEEDLDRPVLGFAFDGTGYGTDGAVWGGECLLVKGAEFERLAHLEYFPLPGGDAAAREIWRLAVALLGTAGTDELPEKIRRHFPYREVRTLIRRGINCPGSSSMGRLFDAVAAVAGIGETVSFEAQAGVALESLAHEALSRRGGPRSKAVDFFRKKVYNFEMVSRPENNGPEAISTSGILRGVWEDVKAGQDRGVISLKFHLTLTDIVAHLADRFGRARRIRDVVLSGGVFQNRLLLSLAAERLERDGFNVHFNRIVPANDGGISLGQAWIALKTVVSGK